MRPDILDLSQWSFKLRLLLTNAITVNALTHWSAVRARTVPIAVRFTDSFIVITEYEIGETLKLSLSTNNCIIVKCVSILWVTEVRASHCN